VKPRVSQICPRNFPLETLHAFASGSGAAFIGLGKGSVQPEAAAGEDRMNRRDIVTVVLNPVFSFERARERLDVAIHPHQIDIAPCTQ